MNSCCWIFNVCWKFPPFSLPHSFHLIFSIHPVIIVFLFFISTFYRLHFFISSSLQEILISESSVGGEFVSEEDQIRKFRNVGEIIGFLFNHNVHCSLVLKFESFSLLMIWRNTNIEHPIKLSSWKISLDFRDEDKWKSFEVSVFFFLRSCDMIPKLFFSE